MPWAAPRHCSKGHPAFTGPRCPVCAAAYRAKVEASRPSARERGYGHKWRKMRDRFLADHPWCVGCGAPATVVDHIVPHKGDGKLFFDRSNWQSLCKPCHDRKTAKQDGGFGRGVGADFAEGGGHRSGGLARTPSKNGPSRKWEF